MWCIWSEKGFSFSWRSFCLRDGGIHVLAPLPPQDCSGLCCSYKHLLIYFRRKHRWWSCIDLLGEGSANILFLFFLNLIKRAFLLILNQLLFMVQGCGALCLLKRGNSYTVSPLWHLNMFYFSWRIPVVQVKFRHLSTKKIFIPL